MRKSTVKTKHSKDLKLSGKSPDFSHYKVKKNQSIPRTRHSSVGWDHLIAKLDKGDAIDMNKKESHSLANRARNLGYVVVIRKQGDDAYNIWFGGLKK